MIGTHCVIMGGRSPFLFLNARRYYGMWLNKMKLTLEKYVEYMKGENYEYATHAWEYRTGLSVNNKNRKKCNLLFCKFNFFSSSRWNIFIPDEFY